MKKSKYYSEMVRSITENTDISVFVRRLKSKKITHDSLPESMIYHKEIAKIERQLHMRTIVSCGYDCIRKNFYANEIIEFISYDDEDNEDELEEKISVLFHSFEEYYEYLDGGIYTNSTYFNYEFSQEEISRFNIDISRLNFNSIFNKNINDFSLEQNDKEFKIEKFKRNADVISYSSLCSSRKLLKKYYDCVNDEYVVEQSFLDENNRVLKYKEERFEYFIDFLHYINYDLSSADLIMCDGLSNVKFLEKYNISKALIRSDICEKCNLPITSYDLNLLDFPKDLQINNEQSSLDIYNIDKNTAEIGKLDNDFKGIKIGYISDLHLEYRLKNEKIITENDLNYHLFKIANNISAKCREFEIEYLIITGDVSYSIDLFKKFIEFLYISNKRRGSYYSFSRHKSISHKFIFTLGNHELWQFSKMPINHIIDYYRKILQKCNMYLLHNEILYLKNPIFGNGDIQFLSSEEILSSNFRKICENDLNLCNMVLFGGIGFSGLNEEFNANNGIYRDTITRTQEIEESKKFNNLYERIAKYLKKEVVIATHMPLQDWSKETYNENFIYVSGHTHRNVFIDDGMVRIYSDNQVGYKGKTMGVKYFYIDDTYDYFNYYSDGIYNINKKDYMEFYNGKKQYLSFKWTPDKLYMIKKNNYYMFLHESKSSLCLLFGGGKRKLDYKNVDYYYENMDKEIAMIKKPLDKFSKIQRKISNEVKKIGGEGTIHGAIIDISFFTHIYVNPYDLTLTYYWASSICNKLVYKSLSHLLEKREPELYLAYKNLLEKNNSNLDLTIFNHNNIEDSKMVVPYLETDIYKASLQIKRMQRLNDNVLSVWYPLDNLSKSIESNNKESKQKLLKVKK